MIFSSFASFYAATNCDKLSDIGIKCKSETRPAAAPYRDATACRDVGRCRHLDSPPRHSALEPDTVLPMLGAVILDVSTAGLLSRRCTPVGTGLALPQITRSSP